MAAEADEALATLGACSCFPSGVNRILNILDTAVLNRSGSIWRLGLSGIAFSQAPAPWILHALAWCSHDMDVNVPALILAIPSILSMAWLRSLCYLIWVSGIVRSSPGTAAC